MPAPNRCCNYVALHRRDQRFSLDEELLCALQNKPKLGEVLVEVPPTRRRGHRNTVLRAQNVGGSVIVLYPDAYFLPVLDHLGLKIDVRVVQFIILTGGSTVSRPFVFDSGVRTSDSRLLDIEALRQMAALQNEVKERRSPSACCRQRAQAPARGML